MEHKACMDAEAERAFAELPEQAQALGMGYAESGKTVSSQILEKSAHTEEQGKTEQ
jgi:hypothetical protein